MRLSVKCGLLAVVVALAGCSMLEGDKIDYKSAQKGPSLEVPPDLTQLNRESRYVVPGGPVSANSYSLGQSVPTLPTAATAVGDVRIERAGNQRWLVVNRPADQLWGPVRDFWQENGFLLELDQPNLGIMETDWAENRAKIPQDIIRSTIGKVFDSLYSTSERDKFRTRLERSPNGGTEIYISHRGMQEVYSNTQKDQTVWQPRPSDPELEAEFLRRLMVKLGAPATQAADAANVAPDKPTSRVASVDHHPVVVIDEGFDRAWRRVGLALDRTGFTVEDRDRSQGTYFVRYVPPNADKKEPGFFGKLFSRSGPTEQPLKYRINLKTEGQTTTVSVLNANGAPEASDNAQRIVQVIADDLK
ncbi:outer membrane protein assembly factor BamC [Ramlibacter ginsenosidimutans]|uniref:Outer membrane protein assembly factor BamC n=1 Tax=Ramlibacter ginsenosidimutans TaxID=502333 RepID=A0A934WN01_9BURK|nr:outer membrane protein assembly factor BamC [Ramlibacter ginsenosidimutans]MBK6008359.1 outer membrane protein assembly factor BamC [Ramlibacter ginsenosidimutans]